MTQKLDIVEFAVHQFEQSLLTILIFGGAATVRHLAELHSRIVDDWDEQSAAAARAVECIMEAINVDNNGKVIEP